MTTHLLPSLHLTLEKLIQEHLTLFAQDPSDAANHQQYASAYLETKDILNQLDDLDQFYHYLTLALDQEKEGTIKGEVYAWILYAIRPQLQPELIQDAHDSTLIEHPILNDVGFTDFPD